MNQYATVPLGDKVNILSGFAFKSANFGDQGDLPLVRIRDVARGASDTYYTGEYDPQFVVNDGDMLISMDGEFRVNSWSGGQALLNQRVCKISPSSGDVDGRYLLHFLPRELKRIEDQTPFVTVKHLSAKSIRAIELPLPPLEEQRRIAAILDKADAIRRKRQQALNTLEEMTQSVFVHTVGPKATGYKDWEMIRIADLAKAEKGSMRTGPFGSDLKHSEFVGEGIAVLGIDNAVKNRFSWAERRFITAEKYENLRRYKVYPGDVIVTIMGTTGRSAVVPDDIPKAITTKHLATISLDRGVAEPEFISNAIHRHPALLGQIAAQNKGAIMAGLNLGIIKGLEIQLPPLAVQNDFCEQLAKIRELEGAASCALSSSDNLFASLSQRAFRGEL